MPAVLVSLTAPKPLVKFFKGRHFVGGRYVSKWLMRIGDGEWGVGSGDERMEG